MQIQLKQAEIESALKDFISKQGINLQGRTVQIEFTSGRKENGITADLSISDTTGNLPDFPDEQIQHAPQVSLVKDVASIKDISFGTNASKSLLNLTSDDTMTKTPPVSGTSLFNPD